MGREINSLKRVPTLGLGATSSPPSGRFLMAWTSVPSMGHHRCQAALPGVLPQPRCLPRGPSFRHWPPPAGISKGARPRAQLDLSSEKSPPSHRLKPPNPHLNSDRILEELSCFPACLLCLPPHLLPGRGRTRSAPCPLQGTDRNATPHSPSRGWEPMSAGWGWGAGKNDPLGSGLCGSAVGGGSR